MFFSSEKKPLLKNQQQTNPFSILNTNIEKKYPSFKVATSLESQNKKLILSVIINPSLIKMDGNIYNMPTNEYRNDIKDFVALKTISQLLNSDTIGSSTQGGNTYYFNFPESLARQFTADFDMSFDDLYNHESGARSGCCICQ